MKVSSASTMPVSLVGLSSAGACKNRPDYAASSAGFGRVQVRNIGVFAKG
jgi:hypothetical protein